MILVYGRPDDAPIASTIEALQEAEASYRLLDQNVVDREDLFLEFGDGGVRGKLTVCGETFSLEEIRGIYARPLDLPTRQWDPSHVRGATVLHEQLFEWLDVSPALVVNRPRAMQANSSKPLQIQLIAEGGFLVPDTLVTNDPDEVRAFWREHGRIVYKSSSGVRSIVQEMDEDAARRLDKVEALPTQFQQWIPGVDIRVHVVGEHTFAARIEGSAIDYRYAARYNKEVTLTATELPPEIATRCVALSRAMELPLAGVDLRLRPDGEYVCFEVNPMPAYTYFESHTGLPIARQLAQLLTAADRSLE